MVQVFFSYSHKDEELRNELETHLALLKRQGVISAWHDRRISAGNNIGTIISRELEDSEVVLLLVSANFLSSDYCYEKELTRALEKERDGSTIVIPVILHPCDWHSAPFGQLRATPTDGKAISLFANQHEALAIVAKDVREAINKRFDRSPSPVTQTTARHMENFASCQPTDSQRVRSSNLRVRRKFDDHERDHFLEDSYEYIARYFEGSLEELANRNSQLKTRFKRVDATSFSVSVYENGQRVAQCAIWYGKTFGSPGIAYSNSGEVTRHSYNESLSVGDDGFALLLRPLGMHFSGGGSDKNLTQQGAAEFFWEILIQPLQ